jgi:hypothetical protein
MNAGAIIGIDLGVTEHECRPRDAPIDIRKAQLGTWAGAYRSACHAARTISR